MESPTVAGKPTYGKSSAENDAGAGLRGDGDNVHVTICDVFC